MIVNIVLFLLFNILAFSFWYFFRRDAVVQPPSQNTQQETPATADQSSKQQESILQPPVAFFQAPQQQLLLKTSQELLDNLQILLSNNLNPGFLHVAVKVQETPFSTEQFLEGTAIVMPQALKEKLGDIMLFSFAAQDKKRLGFAAELKESEGANELLRSWEPNMEQDTTSFFALVGEKGAAYTPLFQSTTYQGVPIRFQTFSVLDFGIVYGIVADKLVFTSSFEAFQRATDQLLSQKEL